MKNQLKCGTEGRRKAVRNSTLNGIDYLELIPSSEPSTPPLIIIHFFKPLFIIGKENVVITGGTRINSIGIEWAERADKFTLKQQQLPLHSQEEKDIINEINASQETEHYLIIRP